MNALSYLTDLGLFFFTAHIVIFSVAGGVPFYAAVILLCVAVVIKIMQDTHTLEPFLNKARFKNLIPFFARSNVALCINGIFLLSLGVLALLDILFNFDASQLLTKSMVMLNGFGYGCANIRKSAELDKLWVLPQKNSVMGNIAASLLRPESISVFASFPASILASSNGTLFAIPALLGALILSLKTGLPKVDNVFINQPWRIVASRILIGLSNVVASIFGFMNGQHAVAIGLFMFFVGNCIVAYRTYRVQSVGPSR
jgi:hypothetical protein